MNKNIIKEMFDKKIDKDKIYQNIINKNKIRKRYGYVFSKAKYRNYFGAKSWYYPDPSVPDDESILNNVERANVHLIKSME